MADHPKLTGRGAAHNPPNRFESLWVEPDEGPPSPVDTQFFKDASRSVLSRNDSPDVGFSVSVNPYRGCEHGCVYCYARPTHEYFGLSLGLDFETKIFVKEDAPALLRSALSKPGWQPQTVALSGVTDPYQPVERRLGLTRKCLEVLAEFRNPVMIITKNALVMRDADLLAELASYGAACVCVSITTLDQNLVRVMEPRTVTPEKRLETLAALREANIPAGVLIGPVIPGLTDHESPRILEAAGKAGASFASYVMLRLPHGLKALFEQWLETHFPQRKDRVLSHIRAVRNGQLNEATFGTRMRGVGPAADQIATLFQLVRRRAGIPEERPGLSVAAFRNPEMKQLPLF